MMRGKALVVGATGVVGRYLLMHLLTSGQWQVLALSRRRPDVPGEYRHLAVDLTDAADCRMQLAAAARDVTHVFYAAYLDQPDVVELARINTMMLENVVDAVERAAPGLRHVHLVEGTKWYGSHLGPFKTPARESDARHMPPNMYYDQQDALEVRQQGKPWTWSAVRPHAVCGFSLGSPMNLALVLAIYAAISRELGLPLAFPGKPGAYRALYQCTDSGLLARAIEWMATQPQCANQAFNVTNGDLLRWENLFPRLARFFDMELAAPRHINLVRTRADKEAVWQRLAQRHGLVPHPYAQLAGWAFGDFVFGSDYDIISDMGKARRAGFCESLDSEQMFLDLFTQFRAARVIP
ncbi:MAG: SDR family oxidoreductase [Burkholderiales bacterium]|nr:SDR family oxidoreductase [Burkholderiales bacterium]